MKYYPENKSVTPDSPRKKQKWEDKFERGDKLVTLGSAIHDLLGQAKWERPLSEARVIEEWDSVVGETISAVTIPVRVRDRLLIVAVDNPVWVHELTGMRKMITAKLNNALGSPILKDIKFILKSNAE